MIRWKKSSKTEKDKTSIDNYVIAEKSVPDGYVLIKAPQVRWLYYTTGIKPHKNKNAVPQWFEATKTENKTKYQGKYVEVFMACLKK